MAACQRLLEDREVRVRWAVSADGACSRGEMPLRHQVLRRVCPTPLQLPPHCDAACLQCLLTVVRPPLWLLQVGELLRALCQQLGISVWEQMQVGGAAAGGGWEWLESGAWTAAHCQPRAAKLLVWRVDIRVGWALLHATTWLLMSTLCLCLISTLRLCSHNDPCRARSWSPSTATSSVTRWSPLASCRRSRMWAQVRGMERSMQRSKVAGGGRLQGGGLYALCSRCRRCPAPQLHIPPRSLCPEPLRPAPPRPLQRWRTAAPTAAPTSWPACCSRATAWSGRARGRCVTAPRAGSAWRRASG